MRAHFTVFIGAHRQLSLTFDFDPRGWQISWNYLPICRITTLRFGPLGFSLTRKIKWPV
jgi:hypothetical protein